MALLVVAYILLYQGAREYITAWLLYGGTESANDISF